VTGLVLRVAHRLHLRTSRRDLTERIDDSSRQRWTKPDSTDNFSGLLMRSGFERWLRTSKGQSRPEWADGKAEAVRIDIWIVSRRRRLDRYRPGAW
jgi:hypothetical protein